MNLRYDQLKPIIFSFLFLFLLENIATGQSCYPGGITFTSQAQIDQFPEMNPGCKIVGGDLVINSFNINNLDSLISIEVIEGNLELNSSSLVNFQGLNNLDTIKEELYIQGSSFSLENMEGLESLKVLGLNADYHVLLGSSIFDLSGLDSLQFISGTIVFDHCYNLTSLFGMLNPANIAGIEIIDCLLFDSLGFSNSITLSNLTLEALPELSNLNGIEQVENINSIKLIDLPLLSGLDSLSSISTMQEIIIDNCDMLTTLNGIQGLTDIQQSLTITGNLELEDISALDFPDLSNLNLLEISYNANLSDCYANSVCYYIGAEGNSTINNNKTGCNNETEVLTGCCTSDPALCPDDITICLPDGITFSTQAEVDIFPSIYPGCKRIAGNVLISGSNITHLDSLYSLETLEGDLIFYQNALADFQGLNNIDSIMGFLFIGGLGNSLNSLQGFESLKYIGSDFRFSDYSGGNVENLIGLDSLQTIEGDFIINACYNLTSLTGMNLLSQVNNLEISNCASLVSLDLNHSLYLNSLLLYNLVSIPSLNGLEHLQNANAISIINLESLTGIDSLLSLSTLSSLDIMNCDTLTSLNGLQNLTAINTTLILKNNLFLDDITALNNLDLSTVSNIDIQNNPSLSVCDINSICEYVAANGSISLSANEIGCNSVGEIIVSCCENDSIWCPTPMDNCLPEGITFEYQEQVNYFSLAYPGCKVIGGDLIIAGTDILSLDSLHSIEVIDGDLRLEQSSIINFEGLNNLDTIKQELFINGFYNNSITNFEGLESLKQLGMSYYNDHTISFAKIEDFTGLDSLQKINGKLEIKNCYYLNSLSGMDQLSEIYELDVRNSYPIPELGLSHKLKATGITLNYLPLENLNGIENVDSLFSLSLSYLNELLSIDSLYSLDTLSSLSIHSCNKLKSLNGLQGLDALMNYGITIKDNNELEDISALSDIDISTVNSLTIRDNAKLSTCSYASICEFIEMGGNATIINNKVGCNNLMQIQYDCNNLLNIFESSSSNLIGNPNNYWHNPNNWKNSTVPSDSSYVIVPMDQNCYIQQDSIANCKMLELQPNAVITIGNYSQLNVVEE